MTDREKLIALLDQCDRCNAEYCNQCEFGKDIDGCVLRQKEIIADTLLANGVTFATGKNDGGKWIPITERIPDETGTYIVVALDGHAKRVTFVNWQKRIKRWSLTGARSYWRITNWMPLPEPPKEE